jgi:diacylglycerol kinase
MKDWIKGEINSFGFAFKGIFRFFKSEKHAKFHFMATIIVIILGITINVTKYEWCLLVFAIALVIISEAINTVIEKTVDLLSPEKNEKAAFIKDVAAGAVLIASIAAAIIGLLIFIPYIFKV